MKKAWHTELVLKPIFLKCSKADISNLLGARQLTAHRDQVKRRRQVWERVVEVVKVTGKRGLSYRQEDNEAAYQVKSSQVELYCHSATCVDI